MENMQVLLEPVKVALHQVGEFLPRLVLGLAIVILGYIAAKAARFAVVKVLRAINFNVVTDKSGLDYFLKQGGGDADTVDLIGFLVYWLAFLAFLMVAFNSMGLASVTGLVGQLVLFLPKVMVAVVILAFGAYFARFAGAAVTAYFKAARIGDADLLGRVAFYAILCFVILIAVDQVGLADVIKQTFLIMVGAVSFGFALAFGIGGSKRAGVLIDSMTGEPSSQQDKPKNRPPTG